MEAKKVKTPKSIIKRAVVEIQQEGTIHFTVAFVNQLKYLCDQISEVEWSGLIFYSLKGTMQNLKKFVVTPYYVHLMHKGSAGATEFDDDGSMAALYEAMPELDPFAGENKYFYGKIHSHNRMNVFHSGTDHQDLQDQAGKYNPYYLSVIVNNALDIEAKIAFTAKIPAQKVQPTKFRGTATWVLAEKEVLGIVDLDVTTEDDMIVVSDVLKERTVEVIKAALPKPYKYTPPIYPQGEWGGFPGRFPNNKALPAAENGKDKAPSKNQLNIADFMDEQGINQEDIDVNTYRVEAGSKLVVDYINDYFNGNTLPKYSSIEAFKVVDELPAHALKMLIAKLPPWFVKLTPWQQQNVIIYVADERVIDMGDNIDAMFEAIFSFIKTEIQD